MIKLKRKKAVFTIVRNEKDFLPIWNRYYRQHFDEKDIYYLDHQSTDGSTEKLNNVELVENSLTQDNDWLIKVTDEFQHKLLRDYKTVLFTNVDEIVAPDPDKYSGLDDYIGHFKLPVVRCQGYEVLHFQLDEPPINMGGNISEQRKFWYQNNVYNKPLMSTVPLDWAAGWHGLKNPLLDVDVDLLLIHLHRMDFAVCHNRHVKTSSSPYYAPDLHDKKWGWHHFVSQYQDFAKWFYCVSAAKVLAAEQSLEIFEAHKSKNISEIYQIAKNVCEEIPAKWEKVF